MRKLVAAVVLALGLAVALQAQQWGTWTPGRGAFGDWHWASPVANVAALDLVTGTPGECIAVMDAGQVYCWSGDTDEWVQQGGGTDTDDQTAAEVPIADAGDYYTGADVEAALQELGPRLPAGLMSEVQCRQGATSWKALAGSSCTDSALGLSGALSIDFGADADVEYTLSATEFLARPAGAGASSIAVTPTTTQVGSVQGGGLLTSSVTLDGGSASIGANGAGAQVEINAESAAVALDGDADSIAMTASAVTVNGVELVLDDDARLTDARTPTAHASTHQHGGADEVATATPGANAIPKAGVGGTLAAAWIPTLNQSTTGNAATATALAANGTNCSAGNYPLGVDASGNVEGCTAAGGGGTPGGLDAQVQFNDGGAFGGDAGLAYDKANDILTLAAAGKLRIGDLCLQRRDSTYFYLTLCGTSLGGFITGRSFISTGSTSSPGLEVDFDPAATVAVRVANGKQIGWSDASWRRASGGGVIESANGSSGAAGIRATPQSSPPVTCGAAGSEGVTYTDSDSHEFCFCDGTSWTGLKAGGACA